MNLSMRRRSFTVLSAFVAAAALLLVTAPPAFADHELVVDVGDGVTVTEGGGTDTFTITMGYTPGVDQSMQVDIVSLNTDEATVDIASHTFAAGSEGTAVTITVTGQGADAVTDGNKTVTVRLTTTSANPSFDGITKDVTVTVTDDEVPGITLGDVAGSTAEPDGTASFTVVLDAKPTANVTVTVTPSDATEATASSPLTFTDTNWNTPQTVTLTAADDDIVDGTVSYDIDLAASGGGYDGVTAQTSNTTTDDDTAGITVTPTSGLVTSESGASDTFTVVLTSQPTADVTVGVSSADASEVSLDLASLTFTAANWDSPQTVTATGADDSTDDGNQLFTIVLGAADSGDVTYDGIDPDDVTGVNVDNDTPPPPASERFEDLDDLGQETLDAIDTLVELGITNGTSATTYSPHSEVTRWQMALFVSRQLQEHGVSLPEPTYQGFTDLEGLSAQTIDAISQIAALGVTTGTDSDSYTPDAPVTRWQMALFMTRVLSEAGFDLPAADSADFVDISGLDAETQVAIGQLAELGVVFGTGGDRYSPDAPVSRWQMALFIVRTLEAAGDLPA
ncbi:MAG: S-layer homology domain-containing protein [Acidimicrobiia bacterium]|nr:S-layer homology domain-containing protein [Acidimicrobiia bacterium]